MYREAIALEALPEIDIKIPRIEEILLKTGSDKQICDLYPREELVVDKYDAILTIWGEHNTKPLAGVDSNKISIKQGSRKEWMIKFTTRVANKSISWVGTQFPTHSDV